MAWYGGTYGRDATGQYHDYARSQRKRRVDECAWVFSADEFRREFIETGWDERIAFNVFWHGQTPRLERTNDILPFDRDLIRRKDFGSRVRLVPVPCPLYTKAPRWYFVCDGCQQHRRFLYAPEIGGWFRCRECHELTYESAQAWDNVARRGRFPGLLGRIFDEVLAGRDPDEVLRRLRRRR